MITFVYFGIDGSWDFGKQGAYVSLLIRRLVVNGCILVKRHIIIFLLKFLNWEIGYVCGTGDISWASGAAAYSEEVEEREGSHAAVTGDRWKL